MGFDFSIQARIKDKLTGEVISGSYSGYEDICYWGSRIFLDHRAAIIEICNKYSDYQYSVEADPVMVSRSALREICAYIFRRCCISDNELNKENDWRWREGYEITNIDRAIKLHDFLVSLDYIEFKNTDTGLAEQFISDPQKRALFEQNPQNYEWEFRIDNHYSGWNCQEMCSRRIPKI